jgi:hypothetical protein
MNGTFFSAVAFAVLCVFLGILVFKLPRPDLISLVALTLALAFYDLFFFKRV